MKKIDKPNLPNIAFGRSQSRIVVIMKGENGYHSVLKDERLINALPKELNLEQKIDYINQLHGVTKAQRQAMEFGSMFGWNLPLANPDVYNENGIIIPEKLKKH